MSSVDSAKTADVIGRLSRRLRLMVREELSRGRVIQRRQAVVVAVNAGPPASVDIQIGGSAITISGVRYFAHYAPVVDDTVWVDELDGDLLVIGDLA